MIRIKKRDSRSLDESTLDKDSSVLLIYHDPGDHRSLILMRIIPKKTPLNEQEVGLGMQNVRAGLFQYFFKPYLSYPSPLSLQGMSWREKRDKVRRHLPYILSLPALSFVLTTFFKPYLSHPLSCPRGWVILGSKRETRLGDIYRTFCSYQHCLSHWQQHQL